MAARQHSSDENSPGWVGSDSDTEHALQQFTQLAGCIPRVRRIVADVLNDVVEIWTLIDAEPWQRAFRDPIYRAEAEVLTSHPEANIEFHLINSAEYANGVKDIVPTEAYVLFAR